MEIHRQERAPRVRIKRPLTEDIQKENYETKERFIAYFTQINMIRELKPATVLNIGMGTGFLKRYFGGSAVQLVEADIDPDLNPDMIIDISKKQSQKKQFDVVTAFQILEHIPFDQLSTALENIHGLSKKWAIVSIPQRIVSFSLNLDFPLVKIPLRFDFERLFESKTSNAHHQWEMGLLGTSKRDVRKKISEWFNIEKEFSVDGNRNHYFFVLSKK